MSAAVAASYDCSCKACGVESNHQVVLSRVDEHHGPCVRCGQAFDGAHYYCAQCATEGGQGVHCLDCVKQAPKCPNSDEHELVKRILLDSILVTLGGDTLPKSPTSPNASLSMASGVGPVKRRQTNNPNLPRPPGIGMPQGAPPSPAPTASPASPQSSQNRGDHQNGPATGNPNQMSHAGQPAGQVPPSGTPTDTPQPSITHQAQTNQGTYAQLPSSRQRAPSAASSQGSLQQLPLHPTGAPSTQAGTAPVRPRLSHSASIPSQHPVSSSQQQSQPLQGSHNLQGLPIQPMPNGQQPQQLQQQQSQLPQQTQQFRQPQRPQQPQQRQQQPQRTQPQQQPQQQQQNQQPQHQQQPGPYQQGQQPQHPQQQQQSQQPLRLQQPPPYQQRKQPQRPQQQQQPQQQPQQQQYQQQPQGQASNFPLLQHSQSAPARPMTMKQIYAFQPPNPLDLLNLTCKACERIIYCGEIFTSCVSCARANPPQYHNFCSSCNMAAQAHNNQTGHYSLRNKFIREEGIEQPYCCSSCNRDQNGGIVVTCGGGCNTQSQWCLTCQKESTVIHACGMINVRFVLSSTESLQLRKKQEHLTRVATCNGCSRGLGIHENCYICPITWHAAGGSTSDMGLCQLCFEEQCRKTSLDYICCGMPRTIEHRMIKTMLALDPLTIAPNSPRNQIRKCNNCLLETPVHTSRFSCKRCNFTICQANCSGADTLLRHGQCLQPEYRVLTSRTFSQALQSPFVRCGSCSLVYPKALVYARCNPCAVAGKQFSVCWMCYLHSKDITGKHEHTNYDAQFMLVIFMIRDWEPTDPGFICTAGCKTTYASHIPKFACGDPSCDAQFCPVCFSRHSQTHQHPSRFFNQVVFNVPPPVAQGPAVLQKAQPPGTAGVADAAASKAPGVAAAAEHAKKSTGWKNVLSHSDINHVAKWGFETAISSTTGVDVKMPTVDYVGLYRWGKKKATPGINKRMSSVGHPANSPAINPAVGNPAAGNPAATYPATVGNPAAAHPAVGNPAAAYPATARNLATAAHPAAANPAAAYHATARNLATAPHPAAANPAAAYPATARSPATAPHPATSNPTASTQAAAIAAAVITAAAHSAHAHPAAAHPATHPAAHPAAAHPAAGGSASDQGNANNGAYGNNTQYQDPNNSYGGNAQYQDPNSGNGGNTQYQDPNSSAYGNNTQYQGNNYNNSGYGGNVYSQDNSSNSGLDASDVLQAGAVAAPDANTYVDPTTINYMDPSAPTSNDPNSPPLASPNSFFSDPTGSGTPMLSPDPTDSFDPYAASFDPNAGPPSPTGSTNPSFSNPYANMGMSVDPGTSTPTQTPPDDTSSATYDDDNDTSNTVADDDYDDDNASYDS